MPADRLHHILHSVLYTGGLHRSHESDGQYLKESALIRSWGGVLTESITLMSIIVSVIRFGWKEMGEKESGFQG